MSYILSNFFLFMDSGIYSNNNKYVSNLRQTQDSVVSLQAGSRQVILKTQNRKLVQNTFYYIDLYLDFCIKN